MLFTNFAGMIVLLRGDAHVYRNDVRFSIGRGDRFVREFVEFAVHLADLAGAQILPRFRAAVEMENKDKVGGFDPVTVADREAEAAIRREIRRVYPDHGILGEEHGCDAGSSAYTWIVDPIDGTRSFVLGQLHWGTLIALNDGTAPIVGLMRQPYTGETFIGTAARSELRRGASTTRLTARTASRLADVTVCATDPTMFADAAHQAAFARLAPRARSVRFGGDCYTPCLVAGGWADLVVEAGLKPWDVQPLIPIVQGAGGVITDWSGGPADRATEVIIAANRELHAEVVAALAWTKTGTKTVPGEK
jgi:histidinol phosphatase-like enzyme (inositol monophosphatase family)